MADEVSPQMSGRPAVERKNKRKPQVSYRVTPSFPNGQELSALDLSRSICAESCDTGILYLNPQTPNWTLAEKIAELSSEEQAGVWDARDQSSRESLQCTENIRDNKIHRSNKGHLDAAEKKGSNCSKYLKIHKVQSGGLSRQMAFKLKELNAEECSADGNVKKTKRNNTGNTSVEKLLDNCDDGKIPRLLEAMKKRSEVDTEHRPFKCAQCHRAFKRLWYLQSHLQTHTGLKPHECDICGKAYARQGTLKEHMRLHTGEIAYRCPFCDKTFFWSSDYYKHIHTHTGEKA